MALLILPLNHRRGRRDGIKDARRRLSSAPGRVPLTNGRAVRAELDGLLKKLIVLATPIVE